MHTHTNKSKESKSQAAANTPVEQKEYGSFQFEDNRPETVAQRILRASLYENSSPKKAEDDILSARHQKTVSQRKELYPHTHEADIDRKTDITNTDTVTVGPETVSVWELTISRGLSTPEKAIEATRNLYSEIGELTTEYSGYLCEAQIKKLTGVDQHKLIYEKFQQSGVIPAGEVPRKRGELNTAIDPILTPTNMENLRNMRGITELIDPFRIIAIADYGEGKKLTTHIDFSEGQKGYISRVIDTGNGTDSSMEDRANYAGYHPNSTDGESERQVGEGRKIGMADTYSNIHHKGGDETMGSLIKGIDSSKKKVINESGVDAYTKLIAEGGRFNCVAQLGANLTNSSLFFTKKGNKYYMVTFEVLWGKWKAFKTGYSIKDEDIAQKLTTVSWAEQSSKIPRQSSRNYDLDKHVIR
ncbi:hypothetical protein [Roseivirga pacifica]|nr:hypothetical protein [Roseivirga pacifica]MCO6357925.1 hypothetical protein [Roseivirga pacifica]MCO6366364.1 hypothetical protein [Roseivirga pacifica]MCO6373657.1 hypothetical protein [Roseivirga pacifica]MCO6380638.1 hypothetical protein [Roseivirga pacifica]